MTPLLLRSSRRTTQHSPSGVEMELFLSGILNESSSSSNSFSHLDIQKCPFLRNINEPTNFSFSSTNFPNPTTGTKGPIFEDEPNFDLAFKLFHGRDGVVPLPGKSFTYDEAVKPGKSFTYDEAVKPGKSFTYDEAVKPEPAPQFNPLAGKAASIGLSAFGPGGPFNFDFFDNKWKKLNKKFSKQDPSSKKGGNSSSHEALSNEWLETGQCPIAKSYRAVSHVLPLVAKTLQPPSGMKLHCPPVVVAARASLARTVFVKNLRPQPLPAKMLAITALGMAANVPLGIWREHTKKFSPQWFIAVHAAVPFIAMLRKSILMPKTAMALTIAASILGQTIGSRAERQRLKAEAEGSGSAAMVKAGIGRLKKSGQCSEDESGSSVVVLAERKVSVCF